MKILVINCGSSSLRFRVFEMPSEQVVAQGIVDRIGRHDGIVRYETAGKSLREIKRVASHAQALSLVTELLVSPETGVVGDIREIGGVGHRVVHGGEGFDRSVVIDDDVIRRIREYEDLAPLHNPPNLAGISAARALFPHAVQAASFDTAFHTTIPQVAYLYAIPLEYYEKHRIRRYGFHGTSHRYVARRAAELLGRDRYAVNVVTCHLGNGCSITAGREGRSVDTSMGFTPLEGLVMGTRSGDIDPGVIFYLGDRLGMTPRQINDMLNRESGLLGVSQVSNDFRDIHEAIARGDRKAKLALELFAYRVKKYIGAYLAVLGRVDAIVFTAGIGERDPVVRERSLSGMEPLGVKLDAGKNAGIIGQEAEISTPDSTIKVFVIPTNEELRIAYDTWILATNTEGL